MDENEILERLKQQGVGEGLEEGVGNRFEEVYGWLKAATNMPFGPCVYGAWLSLSKDDRGSLKYQHHVASFLGVERTILWEWRIKYNLDAWAEEIRRLWLRGERLGEVDRVAFQQAIDPTAPVDSRRLFYQRAGVLPQEVTLQDRTARQKLDEWLRDLRNAEDETEGE